MLPSAYTAECDDRFDLAKLNASRCIAAAQARRSHKLLCRQNQAPPTLVAPMKLKYSEHLLLSHTWRGIPVCRIKELPPRGVGWLSTLIHHRVLTSMITSVPKRTSCNAPKEKEERGWKNARSRRDISTDKRKSKRAPAWATCYAMVQVAAGHNDKDCPTAPGPQRCGFATPLRSEIHIPTMKELHWECLQLQTLRQNHLSRAPVATGASFEQRDPSMKEPKADSPLNLWPLCFAVETSKLRAKRYFDCRWFHRQEYVPSKISSWTRMQ